MTTIQADYHVHTPRCKHAAGPMEAYVEAAIALGLPELGFSDHNPLPRGIGASVRMDEAELEAYVADVLRLRDRYRGAIVIRLGLEMDYVEGLEDYCAAQARAYPWDYLIGSVHYLDRDGRSIAWPRGYDGDVTALYARYYTLLGQMARSGLVDIVAHFDLPKRSGCPPTEREHALALPVLDELARLGVAMEINTSGLRHPELKTAECYPSWDLVRDALARGVRLTVNSDAHAPAHVGTAFADVADRLRAAGAHTLHRYEARRPLPYGL